MAVRVTTLRSHSEHSELIASPRKPKVRSEPRSAKLLNWGRRVSASLPAARGGPPRRALDVWYFAVSPSKSASSTPQPLSDTSMSSVPCSFSRTSTAVAPASSAFSSSSFTALAMSKTTWPDVMR